MAPRAGGGSIAGMQRRDTLGLALAVVAVAAVLAVLLVFKVRVFMAGGKMVVALAAILAAVWLITRARHPRD